MNYYINEYSLRGQFRDVDDFFDSLRIYTLPVLKKIESDEENIIWKKDDLWNAKICNNITLNTIPKKKNESTPQRAILINKLIKLAYKEPHWNDKDECEVVVKEYRFDEEYRANFQATNCFTKGLYTEGRIVSFLHNSYTCNNLEIIVQKDTNEIPCVLENIYSIHWWDSEPKIQTWYINEKYKVEIRAKEFDYHPPHFHVSDNEHAAVFTLKNGALYREGKNSFLQKDLKDIHDWYNSHKDGLLDAWNNLHFNKSNTFLHTKLE